ncbi:putative Ig domain-containing protein [Arundinibacter roseus]|uniref:T9SS type A sorting domain-containing protein n=1 Tax=Arundinibacter roseus TaxID=2070510 RepID=A0A4V2X8M7_9BACT|nr:putative Ig domain-containing protein [Arundinibacter roseus]TDB60445.1 T9SS type A sorting domain-containing protein [Arundinibacter roseus]
MQKLVQTVRNGSKSGIWYLIFGFFLLLNPAKINAQVLRDGTENQRYLALLLLNLSEEKDFELEVIRQAAAAGMNSVVLTIYWDKVYRASPTGPGNWSQFDNQIKLATELGMKVGIRIHVGRNMAYLNGFWTEAESAKDYRQNPLREIYNYTHFSFLHQPSVNKAADFVKQVTDRYKFLQSDNKMLFMSVVTTPTQEAGYHPTNIPPDGEYKDMYLTAYDYSDFYKKGFIEWLKIKYKKLIRLNLLWGAEYKTFEEVLPPVTPWDTKESFFGRRGKDWYIYRHIVLKQFNDLMIQTVKDVNPAIPYVLEFGSVIDNMSALRATLAFPDLGQKADGVKIHDSEQYDHRWTMDVLRGNSRPDQWIMNEVFYADYLAHSEYYEQIDECFDSGAKLVAFVLSTPGHVAAVREVLRNSASKWLSQPMQPLVTQDTVSYRLSRIIDKTIHDLGTYEAWRKAARGSNPPRPVHVQLIEDLLQDDYWLPAANAAPYIQNPIPMQIIAVSRNFTYRIPTNTFADTDGTVVKIEVDKTTLPAWLRYENDQLIGLPSALGDSRLLVRATDDEGATTEAFLTIRVDTRENANKPPTVKTMLANVVTALNESFVFTIPKDLFVDDDGTVTRIEASELPAWLSFNNGEFRGFPTKTGEYRVALKAYDDLNAFVEIYFIIRVVEPQFLNNPPFVQATIPVRFAKVNEPFSYVLPANIFGDSDGYITLITAQNLPSWLSFSLNEFSGIPPEEGEFRIIMRAYDNVGGYVDTPLIIKVEIPAFTFDLLRSGRAIDRQLIQKLTDGDTLSVQSLPDLINIYAYGNFDFDRVTFAMTGPFKHSNATEKFPHALFRDESGFAPYIGGYTLTAQAYKEDSLVLTNTLRFSISAGDSTRLNTPLADWLGYPNPFNSVFNIQLPEDESQAPYSFTLVTTQGQRIPIPANRITVHSKIAQIDVTSLSLSSGMYFVRVESAGELLQVFRVVKR